MEIKINTRDTVAYSTICPAKPVLMPLENSQSDDFSLFNEEQGCPVLSTSISK